MATFNLWSPPLLRALRRHAARFMVQPSRKSLTDLVFAPLVDDFVFTRVLCFGEQELLAGAAHAASVVNDGIKAAVQGDPAQLEALDRLSLITPSLAAALSDEVLQARGCGDDTKAAYSLAQLDEASRQIQGPATLLATTLIVGGQRDYFPTSGMRHTEIGSHLIVCDRAASDGNPWSVTRQTELLAENGCSVQLIVAMGEGAQTQRFMFEAAVDGTTLFGEDEQPLHISVADINERTNSALTFWQSAASSGVSEGVES